MQKRLQKMQPLPNNTIVYYASSDPKYTGSVGIITSSFISPKSEILTQDVKFAFGTFRHEFTHLHEVKKFTDKQKQSLEKLKLIHPHLFKDNEMRNFNLGDCVTHPEHQITGTVISERGANGHYKVLMDDGRDHVFHEDEITLKNNMTELEKAEKRIPMIVKFIQQFLATDLAQQLSPAQRDAINKPGNYTTWPKLTEKLIKDDLERQAMEFINATKEKQATNIIPTSTAQQSETVGSNTKSGQEDSQATTEIVPQVELAQLVRNTNAIIEIDVNVAIEYIDNRITTFVGESEALEAELKKWFKDLAARRLDLTRPVKESLQTVIDDEKRIGAYLEKIFAANAAKREAAEKDRKAKKYTEVMAAMADMLNTVDLPPEYLAKVVFREEYYQVTFKGKKLAESIQEQINTQVSLYNGYLAELELKQQQIKNRELLLENLNTKYGANGTYSMFTIEMFSDDQVLAKYEANHQRKLKLEQEKADAEKIKNETKTEAVAESSTLPVVNVSLPYSPMGGQQKHSTPHANIESSPPAINSSSPETETVIMFKLVVTGRTQADHERLLPKFIDKINAAVDVGLAPAVNAGFGYKFEVVE
jgi:hypothetical protein